MVLVHDTLFCHDDHLYQLIFKSHHAWLSYLTMHNALERTVTFFATHRLVMMIICAKLFLNPTMHNKVMGGTRTGFTEVYAQSSSVDCDLDLYSSDMVLVRDTSSCHDDHLCKLVFQIPSFTSKF